MTDFETKEYSAIGIPQFIDYFSDKFEGSITKDVYAEYLKFWKGPNISKIAFSRYITKFTDYQVKGVSRKGIKYRVFTVQP